MGLRGQNLRKENTICLSHDGIISKFPGRVRSKLSAEICERLKAKFPESSRSGFFRGKFAVLE